jgi:hypothetical protein
VKLQYTQQGTVVEQGEVTNVVVFSDQGDPVLAIIRTSPNVYDIQVAGDPGFQAALTRLGIRSNAEILHLSEG